MSFISSIATEEDIEEYIRSQHKCVGNKEFSKCANYGLTCQVNNWKQLEIIDKIL